MKPINKSIWQRETIVEHLNKRDPLHTYKYKTIEYLNQRSPLADIEEVMLQLMEKEAEEGTLTVSEEYILSGYIYKYVTEILKAPRTPIDVFDLVRRVQSDNRVENLTAVSLKRSPTQSPRNSPKRGGSTIVRKEDEGRSEARKQLSKVKRIWLLLQIKVLLCPNVHRESQQMEKKRKKEMAEIMERINEVKEGGEEKKIAEVHKLLKRFKVMVTQMVRI